MRQQYALDKHLTPEERIAKSDTARKLERELPEAVKLPPVKWGDNVQPIRAADLMPFVEMLTDCEDIATADKYDQRYTIAK